MIDADTPLSAFSSAQPNSSHSTYNTKSRSDSYIIQEVYSSLLYLRPHCSVLIFLVLAPTTEYNYYYDNSCCITAKHTILFFKWEFYQVIGMRSKIVTS